MATVSCLYIRSLNNVGNQTLTSMATVNCLITNILQNIFFCVLQKKDIHIDLEQLEGE